MEILVYQQIRILNKISEAMKSHLETDDNPPSIVISGFKDHPYSKEPDFDAIIFDNTEDIDVCLENFKNNYTMKDIISVHLIKNKEIIGNKVFSVTTLNAKINVAGIEFDV